MCVLAGVGDLANAVSGELCDLSEDLARAAALLSPADERDYAIGALRVAAHRDLHPGLEAPLAMHRQAAGEAAVVEPEAPPLDAEPAGPDPFAEVRNRARPEGDVDVRVELEEPLALRLGVAAADGDHLLGIARLEGSRLREMRGEALVGLFSDRAGVEDDHVRLVLLSGLAEAELLAH